MCRRPRPLHQPTRSGGRLALGAAKRINVKRRLPGGRCVFVLFWFFDTRPAPDARSHGRNRAMPVGISARIAEGAMRERVPPLGRIERPKGTVAARVRFLFCASEGRLYHWPGHPEPSMGNGDWIDDGYNLKQTLFAGAHRLLSGARVGSDAAWRPGGRATPRCGGGDLLEQVFCGTRPTTAWQRE